MLTGHRHNRTSQRRRLEQKPQGAAFATTQNSASSSSSSSSSPTPRRGGAGRSLLIAATLGAMAGSALVVWDYFDPERAAPLQQATHQTLDTIVKTYRQVRHTLEPYVQEAVTFVTGQPPSKHDQPAHFAQPSAPVEIRPVLSSEVVADKEEIQDEEKRARAVLLEGVNTIHAAKNEENEDDGDKAAVTAADIDAVVASEVYDEPAPVIAVHLATSEEVSSELKAAEEQQKREREEEEEEKQRKAEEERKAAERRRLERDLEERRRLDAEVAERRKKELEERAKAAEQRKEAIKQDMRRRHEETQRMRAAAINAKHKREEEEHAKLEKIVPTGLLSVEAPSSTSTKAEVPSETHPTPSPLPPSPSIPAPTPVVAVEAPAPVAPQVAPEPEKSEHKHHHHHHHHKSDSSVETIGTALLAAAENAKKEVEEKYNRLMREKEQLVQRVHALEAEAYAAQWHRSMTETYGSIAQEMASRKFLNQADFAHLSALFTGYISLKNALDKEQPFHAELVSLKRSIHDDLAHQVIESIPKSAATGVPTLQRITTSFHQYLVPAIRQVAFTANQEDDIMPLQQLKRMFGWWVLGSRRVKLPQEITPVQSTYNDSERVLAYTQEALNRGDLMSALQHIRRLPPGPVAEVGQSWAQGLHNRLVVEQATLIFDALIPPSK